MLACGCGVPRIWILVSNLPVIDLESVIPQYVVSGEFDGTTEARGHVVDGDGVGDVDVESSSQPASASASEIKSTAAPPAILIAPSGP